MIGEHGEGERLRAEGEANADCHMEWRRRDNSAERREVCGDVVAVLMFLGEMEEWEALA